MAIRKFDVGVTCYLLATTFGIAALPATSTPATADSDCHCRTSIGERVQVGNFTCIKTNNGLKEARCEFVLNNTAWKLTGNHCPSVRLQPEEQTPQMTLARIDFKS